MESKTTVDCTVPFWKKFICTFYHCPKNIVCLLFGNEHKPHHRILTGIAIIVIGTIVAGIECQGITHMLLEAGGFFIHGMGSIPIIEHIARVANSPTMITMAQNAESMGQEVAENITY